MMFRKSKITNLNAKADEEYADDQDPDDRSEEFVERSKLMQEFFNKDSRGDIMNPEELVEGFDLPYVAPKAEIGEGLDLKADEAFADDASIGMTMGLRELLSVYGKGMSTIEENLRSLMKLESFAEIVAKNDASN